MATLAQVAVVCVWKCPSDVRMNVDFYLVFTALGQGFLGSSLNLSEEEKRCGKNRKVRARIDLNPAEWQD